MLMLASTAVHVQTHALLTHLQKANSTVLKKQPTATAGCFFMAFCTCLDEDGKGAVSLKSRWKQVEIGGNSTKINEKVRFVGGFLSEKGKKHRILIHLRNINPKFTHQIEDFVQNLWGRDVSSRRRNQKRQKTASRDAVFFISYCDVRCPVYLSFM